MTNEQDPTINCPFCPNLIEQTEIKSRVKDKLNDPHIRSSGLSSKLKQVHIDCGCPKHKKIAVEISEDELNQ